MHIILIMNTRTVHTYVASHRWCCGCLSTCPHETYHRDPSSHNYTGQSLTVILYRCTQDIRPGQTYTSRHRKSRYSRHASYRSTQTTCRETSSWWKMKENLIWSQQCGTIVHYLLGRCCANGKVTISIQSSRPG